MNLSTENKQARRKLWTVSYNDYGEGIHLKAYADTIVFDCDTAVNTLVAIRFGGYAEHVRGMADAIYGGGCVQLENETDTMVLHSLVKQYRRILTNDRFYTESTLLVQDGCLFTGESPDMNKNDANEKTKTGKDSKAKDVRENQKLDLNRTSYIFCEQDNMDRLFEEIDKKVSIPLIPAFKDYVIKELQNRKILKKLTVLSFREKFDAWKIALSKDEENIKQVIEDGLKSGAITIPGSADTPATAFDDVRSVSGYLNKFGVMVAEKIKGQFNPLFDPSTEKLSPEIIAINRNIIQIVGYSLYDAQLAEAESLKRRLDKSKFGLCVAECGSGKTKIGSTALSAHQRGKKQMKTFNIVLCPSHLSKKWVREIEESLPGTYAIHIKSITELNQAYNTYQKNSMSFYIIITKEKARDGYMKRPSVTWSHAKESFLCSVCSEVIMMDITDDGSKYKVPADHFFFQKENSKNHRCESCGHVLWTALVPNQQSQWVKVSNYGFVHRIFAQQHKRNLHTKVSIAQSKLENNSCIDGCNSIGKGKVIQYPKSYYDISAIVDNPDDHFRAAGACIRFPLSTYIKKKMRGRIDGLIIDELQDYNNDSGQGDAMNELFCCAKKVIGLTGTLINGYSQGIFHLLYRVAPHLMRIDDKAYHTSKEFNDEYGVTECVYENANSEYNSNRRTVRKKIRERQLPGVSPLVYSRFLINSTAFLSLNDMGKQLPEYEEIPVELAMPVKVTREYKRLEEKFIDILKFDKKIASKIMSAFVNLLTVYPDQPYHHKPILSPLDGSTVVQAADTSSADIPNEKDMWLIEKVKEKVAAGGRVIVYTSWIRIDTQERLMKLFDKNNIKADVLTSSVAPNKREEWVEGRVAKGIQVLITNPSLVETGLDLNDFATLVYYNISYKLFTLRQSSRRSWRINQKAPRVEVYFLYFSNVMQHRAIRLMASKLAVAGIIEGNFSDEGLAAMSECQDLTTLLAQELTMGIKDEVEDLSTVFKKMAVLKPNDGHQELSQLVPHDPIEEKTILGGELQVASTIQSEAIIQKQTVHTNPTQTNTTKTQHLGTFENTNAFLSVPPKISAPSKPTKTTKPKKSAYMDPYQLSLFDMDFFGKPA